MKIAQVDSSDLNNISNNLKSVLDASLDYKVVLTNVAAAIFEFGAYLFIISLLVSGALYIYSFGNEQSIERAKKGLLYSFVGLVVFVSVNAGINFYASRLALVTGRGEITISTLVIDTFNTILIVAALGFVGVFIYSGLRYFFTSGNEEIAVAARRGMLYAFIGLIVTAAAFAMGAFLLRRVLGLNLNG